MMNFYRGFSLLLYVLVPFALYWIIRLAVRHGIKDAWRDKEF